jgi:hypothetical protein
MLLYLDHAWDKFRLAGRMNSMTDLQAAVIEGAVQRIRPKIMTICAILFGLLPIMWSPTTQSGADVMKRIAAPMIGGVITSGILELLLYPVIYVFWRKRHLGTALAQPNAITAIAAPVATVPVGLPNEPKPEGIRPMEGAPKPKSRRWFIIALVVIAFAIGSFLVWKQLAHAPTSGATFGTPFATQKVNNLTVTFVHPKGQLQSGENEMLIEFRNTANNQPVDVGTVKLDLNMNMPGMVMHSAATVEPTGTPGQYRVKVKPDMAGDWKATLRYEGTHGSGDTSFSVTVK